jgi:flagellar motor switch protein FliN/FliY
MASSEPTSTDVAAWVAETWSTRLAQAVEAMTGGLPPVTCQVETAEPPTGLMWWEQPLNLSPKAVVWIGAPEASWTGIGRHTLAAAGIDSSEPADAKNTFLEISSQAFSGLCQAVSARLGTSVSCEGGSEVQAPGEGSAFEIAVSIDTGSLPLHLRVSAGLVAAFAPGQTLALEPAQRSAAADEPLPRREPERLANVRDPGTLDLVLGVELPVSVSFGRAELPLKDVLKLMTGSIVELNRGLNDPVEVIVNNCVIARGEVVVIEGNYGVRIQEIVSRDRRFGALR